MQEYRLPDASIYKKALVGGDETRLGYVQYVPVISTNVPCTYYAHRYMLPVSLVLRTTYLEIDIKDRLEEYSQSIV